MQGGPATVIADWGNGGAEEDRTPDLRIANATLSQLSYGPTMWQSKETDHTTKRSRIESLC